MTYFFLAIPKKNPIKFLILFTVFVLIFAKDDLYGRTKLPHKAHQLLVNYQQECKYSHLLDSSKYIKNVFHLDQ